MYLLNVHLHGGPPRKLFLTGVTLEPAPGRGLLCAPPHVTSNIRVLEGETTSRASLRGDQARKEVGEKLVRRLHLPHGLPDDLLWRVGGSLLLLVLLLPHGEEAEIKADLVGRLEGQLEVHVELLGHVE